MAETPRGWHGRGYMPHCDVVGLTQSVSFRLADSLPADRLAALQEEVRRMPEMQANRHKRVRMDQWLDAGMGCCALRHSAVAQIMQDSLWHGAVNHVEFEHYARRRGVAEITGASQNHYRLLAWCIMPNHVHVLIQPYTPLARIVQSWKSFTGRWAMQRNVALGLGVHGKRFWMREYWDRFIRDDAHLVAVRRYIEANPVKAGLCTQATDWRWSSAAIRSSRDSRGRIT